MDATEIWFNMLAAGITEPHPASFPGGDPDPYTHHAFTAVEEERIFNFNLALTGGAIPKDGVEQCRTKDCIDPDTDKAPFLLLQNKQERSADEETTIRGKCLVCKRVWKLN